MTEQAIHPDCTCTHPHADHQQPIDVAGDCDLCDCSAYVPARHLTPNALSVDWNLTDAASPHAALLHGPSKSFEFSRLVREAEAAGRHVVIMDPKADRSEGLAPMTESENTDQGPDFRAALAGDGVIVVESSTPEDLDRAVQDRISESKMRRQPLRVADYHQAELLRDWIARSYPTSTVIESQRYVRIDSTSYACALIPGPLNNR